MKIFIYVIIRGKMLVAKAVVEAGRVELPSKAKMRLISTCLV